MTAPVQHGVFFYNVGDAEKPLRVLAPSVANDRLYQAMPFVADTSDNAR